MLLRCLILLLPLIACAQPAQPDPRELLKRAAEVLSSFKSYEIHSLTLLQTTGGMNNRMEMPTSIAVRRPDHLRIESENEAAAMTVISDGDQTWIFLEPQNKYIHRAAATSPESALGEIGMLKNLPDIEKSIRTVELTGERSMEINGEPYECWVVATTFDDIRLPEQKITISKAVQTNWISKKLGITLQNSFRAHMTLEAMPDPVEMMQATTTTELKLGETLPDSLFKFTPPEDAKSTADWSLPGVTKPEVDGKPLPALNAKTLDGAAIDLAALKGKPVLLEFFTAWCKPCRKDGPVFSKLAKEFPMLSVIGVDAGDHAVNARQYAKETGRAYPVVGLAASHQFLKELSINAYPTVVLIDKEGKVASYEIGARGEAALRADLKKIGVAASTPKK